MMLKVSQVYRKPFTINVDPEGVAPFAKTEVLHLRRNGLGLNGSTDL